MNYNKDLYEQCKMELTYKIPSRVPNDPPITKCILNVIGEKFLSLPIGRTDLIPDDYVIVDKRTSAPVEFPEFRYDLRPSQQLIYNQVEDNCLINANCSWGKTFTGIAIAAKLGQKTLVITHNTSLRRQWEGEVRKTLGISPGVIGGTIIDYETQPIVIANVQKLRGTIQTVRRLFGTLIVDEVHRVPAAVFEDITNQFTSRYKIGLSATIKRKDFLHVVLPGYFSEKVYKPPRENQMTPKVLMVQSKVPFNANNMIPWVNRVNELVARPEYIKLVLGLAADAANAGHKVLVLSDRVEFLETCHAVHLDRSVVVHGNSPDGPPEVKEKLREERHKEIEEDKKDILYGSISIYKEGMSLNYLSALVLAAPTNNEYLLEQIVGRILREQEGKLTPLIIDIVLAGSTGRNQALTRAKYYKSQGYEVVLAD